MNVSATRNNAPSPFTHPALESEPDDSSGNHFNRLRIVHKLSIGGALAVLSSLLLFAIYWQQTSGLINQANTASQGLTYANAVSRVMTVMAQHRGLTAALRAGNDGFAGAVGDKLHQVEAAISQLNALDAKLGTALGVAGEWPEIEAHWIQLRDAASLSAVEDFEAHSRLIAAMQALLYKLGDQSGLFANPDRANAHAAMLLLDDLPALEEALGKLRGKSSALAAAGVGATENQRFALIEGYHQVESRL